MKRHKRLFSRQILWLAILLVAVLLFPASASADWQKMSPPPDVDKSAHGHVGKRTCWLATAANMLAGAGYGDGKTVQERADSIYKELVAHFGTDGGWTDTAISWWLQSDHNKWKGSNPYTVVTVHGHKWPKHPWDNPNGAQFIGNELRRCEMVGLSISWPTCDASIGKGGHAITAWGDSGGEDELTTNPARVVVTDSDREAGGDIQSYSYDAYTNPNPGGCNEGDGWYVNYDPNNHPYIKHIITLCPTDEPSDHTLTQKVVGSYKIHQDSEQPATDLHYTVGTDTDILTYRTTIDWPAEKPPTIEEDSPRRNLKVKWDLTENPVPQRTWVTITTEFVLPLWNAISYQDVRFTYPDLGLLLPEFKWKMVTPVFDKDFEIVLPNMCGGYVVGSFDLFIDRRGSRKLIGQYRFLHEYDYGQDPESHYFLLEPSLVSEEEFFVGNLRFGHSYGFLDTESLWAFEDWMTLDKEIRRFDEPVQVILDWEGKLPYPPGEIYTGEAPAQECPPGCTCLSKKEGYRRGLDFCRDEEGNLIRCGVICEECGVYKYCFRTEGECRYDYERNICVGPCPKGQVCQLNTVYRDPKTGKVTYAECHCKALPKAVLFKIGQRSYTVDEQVYEADVAPFIKNDRTYTPVRYLAYTLGLSEHEIHWDPAARKVTLTRGAVKVELIIGRPVIIINGEEQPIDVPPIIEEDRTFLPARFVAEAFGASVDWEAHERAVSIAVQ